MKSVELKPVQPPSITQIETVVLTHIVKHGLTTSDVWACPSEFGGLDRITIGRAVRRLVALKLVERGLMHHGKFYFVPTTEGVAAIGKLGPSVGLLSEATKILAYARLLIGCREKPSLQPASRAPLIKHCGESFRGIVNRFLVNPDNRQYLGFLRIDTQLHSRPERPAQQIRADLLRFAKQPLLATSMKQNSFEYLWTTVSAARANTVMKVFSSYKRVGRFPISVVVLPELLPLLAGINIQQEVFQTEHQS